jgi:tetratricopeptide (TPR) repeat protein
VPLQWAETQNNLGNALQRLGARERGTERLEEAVAAYRDALEELTRENAPHYQDIAQENLDRVLGLLGKRTANKQS